MKNLYVIRERLNQEIKKAVNPDDSFELGRVRGWIDALEWVLDMI